jgi:hypothetical protein
MNEIGNWPRLVVGPACVFVVVCSWCVCVCMCVCARVRKYYIVARRAYVHLGKEQVPTLVTCLKPHNKLIAVHVLLGGLPLLLKLQHLYHSHPTLS